MKAWIVREQKPASQGPLEDEELDDPSPAPHEIVVSVEACGVCRTDLHIAEGDLPLRKVPVVPGHEVVGRVVDRGADARRFEIGDRVGVAWLRGVCMQCRYCRYGQENLCQDPRFTGWDADGGYAESTTVDEAFAYPLPGDRPAAELAPLLCAGIIGYRALKRSSLPEGGTLGIYGFGASAHITAQLALARGATVHVVTRAESGRGLALQLGCHSAQAPGERPPEPLDSAIIFAPAGELVPEALEALRRGGTVASAGIYMSQIPPLDYEKHLFYERNLVSVTANTRRDGEEFMRLVANSDIGIVTTPYPFEAAPQALADLAADKITGAAVLTR
jgi:propanol-preferring alcohol dehydrogenase